MPSVQEGGVGSQSVTYTYTVTNTSTATTDPVTISAVGDNSGSLLSAFEGANAGSAVLTHGQSVTFSVTETVPNQNATTTYTNNLSVSGADDEHDPAMASASAAISYTDVTPSINVTKTPNVSSVEEEGVGNQQVTYTYDVTNTSAASTDPLSSVVLNDTDGTPTYVSGDTNHDGMIDDGETWVYSLTVTVPSQEEGTTHTDTVTATAKDDEGDPASAQASATISYTHATFQVTQFAQNASGFDVTFDRAAQLAGLNIYTDPNNSAALTPDVTVVGTNTGPVEGSLVWNAATNTATFVKTGGPLAADTYTVTLVSGSNAFRDARSGELLDGNGDGTVGDNYSPTTFTVASYSGRPASSSLPDFRSWAGAIGGFLADRDRRQRPGRGPAHSDQRWHWRDQRVGNHRLQSAVTERHWRRSVAGSGRLERQFEFHQRERDGHPVDDHGFRPGPERGLAEPV